MESVIIASPRPLGFIERLGSEVAKFTNKDGTIVVERDGARVYITTAMGIQAEYEPEALERILSVVPTPLFYAVDFNDIALCREVLLAVCDDATLIVDNDHGVILQGHRYAQRLRDEPTWDWRRE